MIDTVNAVAPQFDGVVLASNPGGLSDEDLQRLLGPVTLSQLSICTIARIESLLIIGTTGLKKAILQFFMLLEPIFFIYNLLLSIRLLLKVRPDTVLCCNGGYPGGRSILAMTIAAKFLNISTFVSIVSMPMPYRIFSQFYERVIDRIFWKSAGVVIVNANSIAHALQSLRGMPASKAEVVHNGMVNAILPIRKKLESRDNILIGCIARMDKAKGVLFLLEAFAHLAIKCPRLHLVLVGSGDASNVLMQRVEELKLSERVKLTGFYDGCIDELLTAFHIYLFPSLHEGFPYSILEAMRAGCAIITTDVGGIPEAVTDGIEGLLVKPASVDSLEQAMKKLLDDGDLCSRLGAQASERFSRDFTLEKMELRLREIFSGSAET